MGRVSSGPSWPGLTGFVAVATLFLCQAEPASAAVRFGRNVFIGGHDFSHQTYGKNRSAVITLYDRKPPHEGCVWRSNGHGGRVKICHLQRIRRR